MIDLRPENSGRWKKMTCTREIFEDLMDDSIWGRKEKKKESKIILTLN